MKGTRGGRTPDLGALDHGEGKRGDPGTPRVFMKQVKGAREGGVGLSSSSSAATMTRFWLAGDGSRQAHLEVPGPEV